ncbi:MAG: hypothetical protein EXS09_20620 [Gemmataceae bacterium]|nr:hypothetical protein [Gemmataceae bacterium]
MQRSFAGIVLALALPVCAQEPAARLGTPNQQPTVRASEPDPFLDGPKLPAARLGPIATGRVGEGPDRASAEERYNWGVPRERDRRATPASRTRESDRDRRDDNDSRGATLRNPTSAQLMNNRRNRADLDDPAPGREPAAGPAPSWWPERERDLNELREQFPTFGDQGDRDRLAFRSDTAFDNFSSPISNPFLAEDPRSLTELRPVYMYQSIPGSQYYYQGGSMQFIGTQARVAFTDRFSVAVHKLGWLSINPGSGPGATGGSGFSEFWMSPKFTFWRAPDTQTLASFGLQFQLPMGAGSVYQDTGTFGLVPYLSIGRRLGETSYGTFHLINVAGIHTGTDDNRSDYFFDSLHLDLDSGNQHRFYPTLELNWFRYTADGTQRPAFTFEGRDLANIGASAAGKNYVSIATGFRYRFTDYLQMGIAAEFGIIGSNDLTRFRLGIDLIWRY